MCCHIKPHESKLIAQILQTGTCPQFAIYNVIWRLILKIMAKYNVKTPKFFVGQTVKFMHHNKNMLFGKIVCVETHYRQKAESPDTDGYHVYAINTPTSKMRSVWIGEQYIDGVVS